LSYTVTAPDGDYALDGRGSFDGWSTETTGETTASIVGRSQQVATPEFSPASGSQVPVTVTISCATPGAAVYYTTNGLVPTTSDTPYTAPVSLTGETTLRARAFKTDLLPSDTASATYYAAVNPGTIVRAIRGSPSTVQDVSLTVTPAATVRAYTVEEFVPLPLQPSAVSDGGKWNDGDRLILWGPFLDHQARTLSYSVGGPNGDYAFDGAASFDGINRSAMGDISTVIQLPTPTNLTAIAGNGTVNLRWTRPSGVAGYNVYFWTPGNVNSPQVLNAGNPGGDYFPVTGLANNTEYYFSVTAYDSEGHESGHSENIKAVPLASEGHLGSVWFDRTAYRPTDQAVVSVMDADLNTDAGSVQTVAVTITSDSDPWGFTMTLVEAGVNSSLFTSQAAGTNLTFTTGASDPTNKIIQVAEGNRITVVYNDVQPAMQRTNTAVVSSSPPANLIVTPTTTTTYGSLLVGGTMELKFTVSNVGTFNISGTVSVPAPFYVVGDNSYMLLPGQSITITIRYAPVSPGSNVATVTLSGGSGATVKLTGSACADPTATTGSITGRVTRVSGGTPVSSVKISVAASDGAQTTYAVTATDGRYTVAGLRPGTHYKVTANPPTSLLDVVTTSEVTVLAGQATPVNIALPSVSQPPTSLPIPVVLVRGYGPNRGWVEDDEPSWSKIRSALTNSGFIVWDPNQPESGIMGSTGHVINGETNIECNAKQLKLYIEQKAVQYKNNHDGHDPPQIHIVAHSMGGLITRRALHDYDQVPFPSSSCKLKVGKAIMLATPNAGSPVADVVLESWAAALVEGWRELRPWFLFRPDEYRWQSTKNLTTDQVRNHFNGDYPWPSIPLYLLSATNSLYGKGKDWNGEEDRCWKGAKAITHYNYWHRLSNTPESINDGAVTKPSVNGEYWTDIFFRWAQKHQSVRFERVPTGDASLWIANPVESISDSDLGTSVDHLFLLHDGAVVNWIVSTLLNPNPTPTLPLIAPLPTAQSRVKSQASASEQEAIPIQVFASLDGIVTNGGVVTLSVTSDAATTLTFELMASDTNTVFRLNDPNGKVIDATTPQTNTNVQYTASVLASNLLQATFIIANPTTGVWKAFIDATSITTTQVEYSLMVYGDSNVGLVPLTASLFSRGQDAVLSCGLADLSTNPVVAVSNALITALVRLPDGTTNSLTLFDDGWRNDGAPNDGIYAAALTNVQQVGTYSIAYRATGTNALGQALQRVAMGTFSVSSGNGNVLGDPIYEDVDTDGDGYANFLQVKCWVNPITNGNYSLAGDLVDASGTNRFSQAAGFAADGTGPMQVTLLFDLAVIRAVAGPGVYHIENLQLFEQRDSGTAWLDAYHGTSIVTISNIPPIAAFTATPTNGVAPLAVTFTDTSTGTITNRFWNFGDGATTNILTTTVLHTYNSVGTNSVMLVVSGPEGVSTNVQANLIVVQLGDSVGDGIPDWWRAQYFGGNGTTTNAQSCATADPDGDGMNNTQEYLAGTHPKNASSVLRVTVLAKDGGGGFVVSWQSVPGKTYKVLYSDSPGGPWQEDLPDSQVTAGTGETSLSYTDTTAGSTTKRFYRIRLVP